MRITTSHVFRSSIQQMQDSQSQLDATQGRLTSGKKVQTAGDDPVAATRIQALTYQKSQLEQYQSNITTLTGRLELSEGTLDGITENLQRIRELAIRAGNGTVSKAERQLIAKEVRERIDATAQLMNTRDANNEYLFGGFQGKSQPFVKNTAGYYEYQGDEGQRLVQVSSDVRVASTDSGKRIFVDVPAAENTFLTGANPDNQGIPPATIDTGQMIDQEAWDAAYPEDYVIEFRPLAESSPPGQSNFTIRTRTDNRPVLQNISYIPGGNIEFAGISVRVSGAPQVGDTFFVDSSSSQGVLSTMERLAEGLESIGDTAAEQGTLKTLLNHSLTNVDNAITSVSNTLASLGARMNTAESAKSMNDDFSFLADRVLSDLQDIDYAAEAATLSFQSVVLQASQQSFVKINGLSLFNFL